MRKHLLRILTVLLIACFGACLFAACGGEGTGTGNGGDETTYTLTYDANGGTGTVAAETHKEGDKVTLKGADAFTNEGYTFKEWSDGSKTYSAGASFTMPAKNVTMKAQWEPTGSTPATYTLTFTGDKDNVDIEIEGGAKEAYEENSKVRFSVTAKADFNLVSVMRGETKLTPSATDGKYEVTMTANVEIAITTEDKTYTVTVTGDHMSAKFDENGPYKKGTVVKFTVTADTGYKVDSVKLGSDELTKGTDEKYSVTVGTQNITVTVTTSSTGGEVPGDEIRTITPTNTEFYGNYFVTLTVAEADGLWIEENAKTVKVDGGTVFADFGEGKGYEISGDSHTIYKVKLVAGVGDTATPKASYVIEWCDESGKTIGKTTVNPPDVGPQTYTVSLTVSGNTEGDGNSASLSVTEPVESGTKVTLTVVTAEGFEAKVTVDGQDVELTEEGTYEIEVTKNVSVNVTFYEEGGEPPVHDTPVYDIKELRTHDNAEYTTLVMEDQAAYAVINSAQSGKAYDTKDVSVNLTKADFTVAGTEMIHVHVGTQLDRESFTIEWYDADGNKIAISHYPAAEKPPVEHEGITNGGEGDSEGNWIYWNDDAAGAVTVTDVTLVENETDGATVTAKFRSNTSTIAWGFQIFYNDTTTYKVGSKYTLSLTATAKSDLTITVNGQQVQLSANTAQEVKVTFVYNFHTDNVQDYNYGTSLLDVQIPLAANTDYDVTLANIKWAEVTATMTVTGAKVEATENNVYFVISGTYDGYEQAALESELKSISLDFQEVDLAWSAVSFAESLRTVTVNAAENTWELKLNIEGVPVHSNPYTGHFNGDLKLTAEQAVSGQKVEFKGKSYEVVNYPDAEPDDKDKNYGCVALKVSNVRSLDETNYIVNEYNDAFIKAALRLEGSEMYVDLTLTLAQASEEQTGYTLNQLKALMLGNISGNSKTLFACEDAQAVEGGVKLSYKVSDFRGKELYLNFYESESALLRSFEGKDAGKTEVTPQTLDHVEFKIEYHQEWNSILLKTGKASDLTITVEKSELKAEGAKAVYVLTLTATGADKNALQQYLSFGNNAGDYTVDSIEEAEGKFTVKFDVTNLTGDWIWAHLYFNNVTFDGNNGDVKTGEDGTTFTLGAKKYHLKNAPGQDGTWDVDVLYAEMLTTVTFDTNEGSEVGEKYYEAGALFSGNKPEDPTKNDYTFLYWYYMQEDVEVKVEDTFVPSDHDTDNALTLYAKWDRVSISYAAQSTVNWAGAVMSDMTLSYGETVTLSGTPSNPANWYDSVFPVIADATETPHYAFVRLADAGILWGNGVGSYDTFAALKTIISASATLKIGEAEPVASTEPLFSANFLNQTLTKYEIVVAYTQASKIVYTGTVEWTKESTQYQYKLTLTLDLWEAQQTYYVGIACDGMTFTGTIAKTGTVTAMPEVSDTISYTGDNYAGTAARDVNFYNNDTDAAWPQQGVETSTSVINATGDFVTIIKFRVARDKAYRDSWVNITPDDTNFLSVQYQTQWGSLYEKNQDKWTTSEEGTIPAADGGENDWTGDYTVTITRIGTTLKVVWKCENGGATWTRTVTGTDCTTDALKITVVGNYWHHDGLRAYYGALSPVEA